MTNESKNKIAPDEYHQMNLEEKILKMADGFVLPNGKPESEALDSFLDKMEQTEPTKTYHLKKVFQMAAAVAILVLSIYSVTAYLFTERETTKFAEQSEITLPDGTEVTLNASSNLVWNDKKFTKKRQLTLKGEAYFNVKKGEQFIIKTKNGTVEILGTQLNVFSRGNDFWVSCIKGKVKVLANNQQQIILPGEWVTLNKSRLEKSKLEVIENTISWTNGMFYFEDTPIRTIFDELERQFNVSIKFDGNGNRLATIDFSNNNLNEALEIVCIPMELNYDIRNNKKIIISEKN